MARGVTTGRTRDSWSHCVCRQEPKRSTLALDFLLFVQSRTPVHGMVPPHLRGVVLIWITLYMHTQKWTSSRRFLTGMPKRSVSLVTLDPVMLIININYNTNLFSIQFGHWNASGYNCSSAEGFIGCITSDHVAGTRNPLKSDQFCH